MSTLSYVNVDIRWEVMMNQLAAKRQCPPSTLPVRYDRKALTYRPVGFIITPTDVNVDISQR
jgi:hypothetical protein